MKDLTVVEILKLGVIGLAFLLAFLAYAILRKEQDIKIPRPLMLTATYVFMAFAVVMCALTIFDGIKGKMLGNEAAVARRRIEAVPSITWRAEPLNNSTLIQCKANGKNIGAPLSCTTYDTCKKLEGNRRVCAGVYYAEAITREHSQDLDRP